MKRFLPVLLILSLAQASCALPFFVEATPTATEIVLPTNTLTPAASSTPLPPTNTATATWPPTETPQPSATAEPSDTPTPTATATQLPFDPSAQYGSPTIFDSMDTDKYWASTDDQYIRLAFGGGHLHVTGKLAEWDTWWFTSPTPSDFFLEMTVETGNCTGKQAYGLIMRGPQTAGGEARGYIFTFSCDGSYRLERLDDTAPYTTEELIPWTESDYISAGDNETNTMGIRMVGSDITLYANGFEIDDLDDGEYASGRFGLFVNAGTPGNYTFDVDELSYWDL
jgi:hypothetical protein